MTRPPFFHGYPGSNIQLLGQNFISENYLSNSPYDKSFTGVFSPFGVPVKQGEIIKGIIRASGSVLRANLEGLCIKLVVWGLRNPFRMKFDRYNRLFSAKHGMDIRGGRLVANSPDEFYQIIAGTWYGWPDFTGGLSVTYLKPENEPQPSFLLAHHPMTPPQLITTFVPHSAIMGFDFSYNYFFGNIGDVYIFAINKSGYATSYLIAEFWKDLLMSFSAQIVRCM